MARAQITGEKSEDDLGHRVVPRRSISHMTQIPGSAPRATWRPPGEAGSTDAPVEHTTSGQWHAQRLADELGRIDQDIDARAERVRASYRSRTRAITNDHDLTPQAVEERKATAREEATARMKELRAELQRERDAAIMRQQQVMLGTAPSDPVKLVAFRDARARAEALTDADQAERAMRLALRDDDSGMAEAIAAAALDREWVKVWRAAPELRDGVEAIANLRRGRAGQDSFFRFSLSS